MDDSPLPKWFERARKVQRVESTVNGVPTGLRGRRPNIFVFVGDAGYSEGRYPIQADFMPKLDLSHNEFVKVKFTLLGR